jgi:hypothetical protein
MSVSGGCTVRLKYHPMRGEECEIWHTIGAYLTTVIVFRTARILRAHDHERAGSARPEQHERDVQMKMSS